MTRKRFSYEEHITLGEQLKQARRIILPTVSTTGNRIGVSSQAYKSATRTLAWLDELRCRLDNVLCSDFPDRDTQGVYYGDC